MPKNLLERMVTIRPGEGRGVFWSFLYGFLLLASYYVIKPVRDEIGAEYRDILERLWTGTFLVCVLITPVFGWLTTRLSRRRFLPLVYGGFGLSYVAVYAGLLTLPPELARWVEWAFYVWTSVFVVFGVSLFWSTMVDLWEPDQTRRLFGFLAAGGTLGGISGAWITKQIAEEFDPVHLILVPVVLLGAVTVAIARLELLFAGKANTTGEPTEDADEPVTGTIWEGARTILSSPYLMMICGYLLSYVFLSSFLYFEQSHIVGDAIPERADRTVLYSKIDLAVNSFTLLLQVFVTGRIVRSLGLVFVLVALPVLTFVGFATLGALPVVAVVVAFQICRRTANFALSKPGREILFSLVPRAEKYRSKNFIDTAVYRGGDLVTGWIFNWLEQVLSLGAMAVAALPMAALQFGIGFSLARQYTRRRRDGD